MTFVCLGKIATSSEEAELGDDSTHGGPFTSGTPTFNADLSLNVKLAILCTDTSVSLVGRGGANA
jgi:hypothetical protein